MKIMTRIGCLMGWLLAAAFFCYSLASDSSSANRTTISVQLFGGVAAMCNVLWQIFTWLYERKEKLRNDRMGLLRQMLLRYVEVVYFIGQICGRSMEANIDDDNVFIRINHLLDNQLRNMIGKFVFDPLSESDVVQCFDKGVYNLCKRFEEVCKKLVDESVSNAANGSKIVIPNVKARAYEACNVFDELMLKCAGFIGGDKDQVDALIQDVANMVI